jgi:Type II secretory pathway, component PulD
MKRTLIVSTTIFALTISLYGESDVVPKTKEVAPLPQKKQRRHVNTKRLINFDFDNEDLITVINRFAEKQQVNVILPQGINTLNQKITFHLPHKITLEQAERYLSTFLDLAGYSKVPHGDDFIMIVKNDENIVRETLPLFINVDPDKLPQTEERIRAIYYLENFKVPDSTQAQDPLVFIFNDMLSKNKIFLFDAKSNAIIVTDKANTIASAMKIILELDKTGSAPAIEVMQIINTSADTIATLLKTQILAVSGTPQGGIRPDVKAETGLFFNPNTRVIADTRTNSLILMGRESSLERIKELVRELDQPEDSGDSILHLYDLQYLDAEAFGPVLQKIVTPLDSASQQATKGGQSGPHRSFEGVIIVGEAVKAVEQAKAASGAAEENILKGTVYKGGNRLIVACRLQDWKKIEQLIKDLDKPEPQVIIEMLIIDLDLTDKRLLAAQIRNASGIGLPAGINFQTTNVSGSPILGNPPTTLASDLLAAIPSVQSLSSANPGSVFFSLNDPAGTGIWGLLQILNTYTTTNVISHPFLVSVNNKRAEQTISTIRRNANNASVGSGGAVISNQVDIEAALKISIVPRVSSADRVNLQMSILINRFASTVNAANLTIIKREIHTDANLASGQILVLGGLTRLNNSEGTGEMPFLSKIPIFGNLFKRTSQVNENTTLMVFMSPTIIEPKIRSGMNNYTKAKINDSNAVNNDESIFSNLRDPITQLFFNNDPYNDKVDGYLAENMGDFVDLKKQINKNKKKRI